MRHHGVDLSDSNDLGAAGLDSDGDSAVGAAECTPPLKRLRPEEEDDNESIGPPGLEQSDSDAD